LRIVFPGQADREEVRSMGVTRADLWSKACDAEVVSPDLAIGALEHLFFPRRFAVDAEAIDDELLLL